MEKLKKRVLIVEDQFVEAHDLQLMLERAGYGVQGIARSVVIAQDMIRQEKPDLVLLDIFLKGKLTGIDLANQLKEQHIAFIYLSANTNEEILNAAKATEPYGFIVKPFREKDLLVTLEIAQYRHEHSQESKFRRESGLMHQMDMMVDATLPWRERLLQSGKILQQAIPFDFITIGFNYTGSLDDNAFSLLRIGFDEYQVIGPKELSTITGISLDTLSTILRQNEAAKQMDFYNDNAFEHIAQASSFISLVKDAFRLRSMLSFPMAMNNDDVFHICFFSRRADTYTAAHVAILQRLHLSLQRIMQRRPSIEPERHQHEAEAKTTTLAAASNSGTTPGFEGIIGRSHLLLNVFDQVTQVAPFDTAVLILGESGTGKERIADCIHKQSPRAGKALVTVNCAALPATLIESELFGHEKGAFTGATDKRIGKFEQANGGTVFLDEIGDMPVDLQVKLLRVLQEKEIEPIGSRSPVKINVRVIAATNKNLEKEVAENRFRLDLYYRLNVFPIALPPLRERADDIPALAYHFINVYNHKSGKKITGLSDTVIKMLMAYHWPGNIRELEHMIERSVLLTKGSIIEDVTISAMQRKDAGTIPQYFPMKTIHENEFDYIIAVLKKCNGRIWGAGGAAEVLSIPPSTLKSKMKKLGIQKADFIL